MRKKVLFVDNGAHHAFGQKHLMDAYFQNGYEVIVLTPNDENYFYQIEKNGYKCIHLKINAKGINPISDLKLIFKLKKLFASIKPNLICSFTIKCNLYSLIAARSLTIPVIANVTGLGYTFIHKNLLNKIVINLYKFSFKTIGYVFFQNRDDMNLFLKCNILKDRSKIGLLPGSGVNITKFNFVGYQTNETNPTTFLYSGRLLRDKGVMEIINAYRIVKEKYPNTKLQFIGDYSNGNPTAIKKSLFQQLQQELEFEHFGMVTNVEDFISKADCIILPSYREGMPRAILEASCMGKVVITTDVAGCKDSVDDGITGFICKVKDYLDLANQMIKVIQLDNQLRQNMGKAGRLKIEKEFDQKIVVDQYMKISDKIGK